jgi:hypothetical protein
MTADVSQDRRVTVLNRGHQSPALTEGSRLGWALPSPVHERSGYRAARPTGYKVMRSFRIVVHGPVLASRLACHRDIARCGRAMIAPSSSRSRPLTRRLRRWPSASLDRASPRRQRSPPTDDALLTTYSPYKVQPKSPGLPCAMVLRLIRDLPGETGLCCHRCLASSRKAQHLHRGARTTRFRRPHHAVRLTTQRGHRIPLPTFVTIAKRPLWARDARKHRCDLPDGARGICTTGNLRMAGMRGAREFVGWAKDRKRRAHHLSASMGQKWWARGACHRARMRATRWLCPPYELS